MLGRFRTFEIRGRDRDGHNRPPLHRAATNVFSQLRAERPVEKRSKIRERESALNAQPERPPNSVSVPETLLGRRRRLNGGGVASAFLSKSFIPSITCSCEKISLAPKASLEYSICRSSVQVKESNIRIHRGRDRRQSDAAPKHQS